MTRNQYGKQGGKLKRRREKINASTNEKDVKVLSLDQSVNYPGCHQIDVWCCEDDGDSSFSIIFAGYKDGFL